MEHKFGLNLHTTRPTAAFYTSAPTSLTLQTPFLCQIQHLTVSVNCVYSLRHVCTYCNASLMSYKFTYHNQINRRSTHSHPPANLSHSPFLVPIPAPCHVGQRHVFTKPILGMFVLIAMHLMDNKFTFTTRPTAAQHPSIHLTHPANLFHSPFLVPDPPPYRVGQWHPWSLTAQSRCRICRSAEGSKLLDFSFLDLL